MPTRFTRVPTGDVPLLPLWARWAVLPADAFMLLMVSRPATGSLARTWVTPGTLQLCIATTVLALVALVLLLSTGGSGVAHVIALVVAAVLVAGAGCVALVGWAQRVAARR